MDSASDFYVFEKWRTAPSYAFGEQGALGIVPDEDKEAYWRIYAELLGSAGAALAAKDGPERLVIRPKPYSRERGSRGHRPVDLYVSICGASAAAFGWYPQVYVIASARGLEIGFAASISEDDYFDANAKARNRTIVPFINSKIPSPAEPLTAELDAILAEQGGWHFNAKTRLSPEVPGFDAFSTAAELFAHLKTSGDAGGGGTVCRLFDAGVVAEVDLTAELTMALSDFLPLIALCAPSGWDMQVRFSQAIVQSIEGDSFDPSGVEDGRIRILTAVARRQGQAKFRAALLDAYGAQCAISGTRVADVLQAAHITPYKGPQTNHVTNGILLRADLHTLFDLRLVRVNPNSLRVSVSPALRDTPYWRFEGRQIHIPAKLSARPSVAALTAHFTAKADQDEVLSNARA